MADRSSISKKFPFPFPDPDQVPIVIVSDDEKQAMNVATLFIQKHFQGVVVLQASLATYARHYPEDIEGDITRLIGDKTINPPARRRNISRRSPPPRQPLSQAVPRGESKTWSTTTGRLSSQMAYSTAKSAVSTRYGMHSTRSEAPWRPP